MRSLVLMDQGLEVGVEGELFVVRKAGKTIEKVKAAEIDEVMLFGNISLTAPCISFLLSRGIDTIFLTARGRYRGRLLGPMSKNPELRMRQYGRMREEEFILDMARAIVRGKVTNQRRIVLRAQRELRMETLARAAGALRRLLGSIDRMVEVAGVRGIEGQAAAVYFGVFGSLVRNESFRFRRRSKRPPRDPINAMLSFGYTMLNRQMENLVYRSGLDPMLGNFHAPEYGRPSLSLDLIEEFRPVMVDSLVLRLVNRRQVTPEDFEEPRGDEEDGFLLADAKEGKGVEGPATSGAIGGSRGIWLGESGRRIFFREWGRRLRETLYYEPRGEVRELKDIMKFQVYHYVRVLKGEEDRYRPYTPR